MEYAFVMAATLHQAHSALPSREGSDLTAQRGLTSIHDVSTYTFKIHEHVAMLTRRIRVEHNYQSALSIS
jgi:hypothetical protein